MVLKGLPGLGAVTVMIMMIMTIDPVLPIKVGRIAERGIVILVVLAMILIMTEAAEEMVVGGDMNPVIENVIRDV